MANKLSASNPCTRVCKPCAKHALDRGVSGLNLRQRRRWRSGASGRRWGAARYRLVNPGSRPQGLATLSWTRRVALFAVGTGAGGPQGVLYGSRVIGDVSINCFYFSGVTPGRLWRMTYIPMRFLLLSKTLFWSKDCSAFVFQFVNWTKTLLDFKTFWTDILKKIDSFFYEGTKNDIKTL